MSQEIQNVTDLERIAIEENAAFLALGKSSFYADFLKALDRQITENQDRMFQEKDMGLTNRMIGANYAFVEIKKRIQEALAQASVAATTGGGAGPLM